MITNDREEILLIDGVVSAISGALAETGDRKKLMNFIDGLYAIDDVRCSNLQMEAFATTGIMGCLLSNDRDDFVHQRAMNTIFGENCDFCGYGVARGFSGEEIIYLFNAPCVKDAFLKVKAGCPVMDGIYKHDDQISMLKSPAIADFFVNAGLGEDILELVDDRPHGFWSDEKYIVWSDKERTAFFSNKEIAQSLAAGAEKNEKMAEKLFEAVKNLPDSAQEEISKALGNELFAALRGPQAIRKEGIPGQSAQITQAARNDSVK